MADGKKSEGGQKGKPGDRKSEAADKTQAAAEPAVEKKGKASKGEGDPGREKKAKGGKGKPEAQQAPAEDKVYKREAPPRLRALYQSEVVPKLMAEFGYKNPMQVPRLTKITLNMGLGEALANAKILDASVAELTAISGQRPVVTKAKKSIATFKLRQGQKIGAMVTLRRERMYEFFDRFVSFALPRVRDFKGLSPRSFDGRGNFSIGVREQIIFPEVDYDKIDKIKGLNVTIGTTARSDNEGRALLRYLGMPFRS